MTNSTTTGLTAATTPLAGTELVPIVQSGSKKVAVNDLTVRNIRANATTDIMQITGPAAASNRVVTVPDANWTAARIDAAQSFTGDQTLSTGNLVQGTAAKGINYTANTPAAGMTSQLLNWYEEGTWTATLTTDATPPTVPVTSTGNYTRVGRLVTVSCAFANISLVGSTGNLVITGVPFTVGATENYGVAVSYGAGFGSLMSRSVTGAKTIGIIDGTTSIGKPTNPGTGIYMLMQIAYTI